jgi:hypothetical protein
LLKCALALAKQTQYPRLGVADSWPQIQELATCEADLGSLLFRESDELKKMQ